AAGERGPGSPHPHAPTSPRLPTWLALWNCFFSPATDIATAPGRLWGVVSGLRRAARPRRARGAGAGAGPRAAGLRRARLPRPGPRPPRLSHSHTRAHADGNTAFQSPCAAHWPSRGGMQMRPPGPPTPHCCVETRGAWAWGARGCGGQAHAGLPAGRGLWRGRGCGGRAHLACFWDWVRNRRLLGGHTASLGRSLGTWLQQEVESMEPVFAFLVTS
uniref:Uncharacterized protein n=1 Tax=Mustela putorius furo TaxID=9669 RepID=M3YVN5_MUSPF